MGIKKLKILSINCGIGAFEQGLNNLSIQYEIINFIEKSKLAAKVYSKIHNISIDKNLKSIDELNIQQLPQDIDILFYFFDYKDILTFTNVENELTKILKIIDYCKPKYCITENVKQLLDDKYQSSFRNLTNKLRNAGYDNIFRILNAVDFGVPQNKKRMFLVSINKEHSKTFYFPKNRQKVKFQDFFDFDKNNHLFINDIRKENIINRFLSNFDTKIKYNYPIIFDDYNNRIKKNQEEFGTLTTNIGEKTPRNGMKLIFKINNNWQVRPIASEEAWQLIGFNKTTHDSATAICTEKQLFTIIKDLPIIPIIEDIYKILLKDDIDVFY